MINCQRIRLRAKKAKRCNHCEHQLIKPDQKTQITRFNIKEMARDRLPSVQIIKTRTNDEESAHNNTMKAYLRFENPLDEKIDVNLSSSQDEVWKVK